MTTQQETVHYLDPATILADTNVRHGLLSSKVDRLAEDITRVGGVQEPVIVEPANEEGLYPLVIGFYRHAAVSKLNAEGGALAVPAIIRAQQDAKSRLIAQVSENVARAEMSPMDTAQAIKKLMDAGVSRSEIRAMFPRPGGRKGNVVTMQPASNAWVNIMLSLLELPKSIQTKIHEGILGFTAAYELGKVPTDKREAVLARAEAELDKLISEEGRDEEKFLKAEQRETSKAEREAKAKAEAEKLQTELAEQRKLSKDSAKLVAEKMKALNTAKKAKYDATDADATKAYGESVRAADADVKAAVKVKKDADNKVESILKKIKSQEEKAAVKANQPEKAEKPKAAVGPSDIKKAAQAEGVPTGFVALKASDIKQGLKDITKDKDAPLRVKAIAQAIIRFCDGELTPKLLTGELEAILVKKSATAPAPVATAADKA